MNMARGKNSLASSRVSSMASTYSTQEERRKLQELTNTSNKEKVNRIVKMNLVIILPIISLLALTGIMLQMSRQTAKQIERAKTDIEFSLAVSGIVNNLQIERGTTAMYMSSNATDIGEIERIQKVRNNTDNSRKAVPPNLRVTSRGFKSATFEAESLKDILNGLRGDIDTNKVNMKEMIFNYTTLNHRLLDLSLASVDLPTKGMPWRAIVAINTLSRASDSVGIQRALGSTFFVTCGFDKETELWFMELETELQTYMQLSFFYDPASNSEYLNALDKIDDIMNRLIYMKSIIQENYKNDLTQCTALTETERLANGTIWFETMTVFIEILREVREKAGQNMLEMLRKVLRDSEKNVAMYTTVTVVISIASLLLGIIYANSINKMTEEIRKYSDKVSIVSLQIIYNNFY